MVLPLLHYSSVAAPRSGTQSRVGRTRVSAAAGADGSVINSSLHLPFGDPRASGCRALTRDERDVVPGECFLADYVKLIEPVSDASSTSPASGLAPLDIVPARFSLRHTCRRKGITCLRHRSQWPPAADQIIIGNGRFYSFKEAGGLYLGVEPALAGDKRDVSRRGRERRPAW